MSLATKCDCGRSGSYCTSKDCPKMIRTLDTFFIENSCTNEERNQVKAFLFVLRHPNINWDAVENLIKKYEAIIFNPAK